MATKQNAHKVIYITLTIILVIILFVIALLVVIRFTQVQYSHKVSTITFSSDSGPVSPEFQQSQILALSPGTCQYTVTKVSPKATTSTPCTISTQNFQKIVDSFNSFNVSDKLQAAEGNTGQQLIGGKRQTINVQLQDGTVLNAQLTPQLKESLQPFIDQATLYVPQLSNLQF